MIREKRWQVFPNNDDVSSKLASSLDVHPITAQVLLNRKIRSIGEAKSFIYDEFGQDYETFLESDLATCKTWVESTLEAKKGIMVFGDYDVDGMTSVTLMMGFLETLGARAIFHIPSRFTEGYGLNTGIIDRINVETIGLLITLDCGVTNVAEIQAIVKKIEKRSSSAIKKALANASAFEVGAIKKRTQQKGIDYKGRPFKPYSVKYKRAAVKQSGVVDLTDTGQMFSSLTSKVTPSKGELFFRQAAANRKAFFHDEAGAGRKKVMKPFFRISKKEETNIEKIFCNVLERELKL